MKKLKRLKIDKLTVRLLDADNMHAVAGGGARPPRAPGRA
jgi:hypothetical protein